MEEKLDFEITEQPVFVSDLYTRSLEHKAIVKNDGSLLSIMKNSYKPFYMRDFHNITNRLGEISGFDTHGYQQFKGGKIVLSYLKNNTGYNKVGDFDLDTYLILGNSFDGSSQIFLSNSTTVLFCQNQFSKLMRTKFKHTTSSQFKLEELVTSIEDYFREKDALIRQFNLWNDISITKDTAEIAVKKMVDWDDIEENSTRKINKAEILTHAIQKSTNDFGNNLWSIMQGMTYYSTHLLNKDKSKNIFGAVVGNQARFNDKAFDIVKELEYV